ncbi:MAG: hypothetical protein A2X94_05530 [Bdellovibrionales bacterium GWB1_55_8]|nr:MAG: hypothetical protein A2X94_05530 [Bdellovibrionales bacterium GWB1_55_8]
MVYQQEMLKISPQVFLYDARLPVPQLPAGAIALPQHPGNIFGDGSHPTTRLCAGAVDFLCRQHAFSGVLDVGTGSGVLARIARARAARFIVGTDINPAALMAAQSNAALDSHPVDIAILNTAPDHWGARFDLVVANILEGPLRELAPSLSQALGEGGLLLISGFTRLQTPGLLELFSSYGLTYVNASQLEEWVLLMFRRPLSNQLIL